MNTQPQETYVRICLTLCAIGVLLGLAPAPATAAELEDTLTRRVSDCGKTVAAHKRAKDIRALTADLARVEALYREAVSAEAEQERKALVKIVGSLTKSRDDAVRKAAIEKLGALGDAAGARYLKPFLKPLEGARGASHTLAAIEAAGKIHPDELVLPLLKIVDKSKHYGAAAKALEALGNYRTSKRHRARILEEVATTLRRDIPGGPKRGHESRVADTYIPGRNGTAGTDRWSALSPLVPHALNALTGQNVPSTLDWMETVKSYRRKLDDLFTD